MYIFGLKMIPNPLELFRKSIFLVAPSVPEDACIDVCHEDEDVCLDGDIDNDNDNDAAIRKDIFNMVSSRKWFQ